jgi:hypothetical protein
MEIETRFLRLTKPAALGDRIDGWRVCWIGGGDKCRVFFFVMVERQQPARSSRSARRSECIVLAPEAIETPCYLPLRKARLAILARLVTRSHERAVRSVHAAIGRYFDDSRATSRLRHAPRGKSCQSFVVCQVRLYHQFQGRDALQIDFIGFELTGRASRTEIPLLPHDLFGLAAVRR